MKKLLIVSMLGLLSVSSMGGTIQWGSYNVGGTAYVNFTDNLGNPFQGYAYLFLLSGAGNEVSWNGTSWNLNGATQLAWDDANASGRWYDSAEVVSDAQMNPAYYYQAILTTTPGNVTLGNVSSGYWAPTAVKQLANYSDIDGINKNGLLTWQATSASWAPVAAVPEPATMALFGLGGLALVIRRKMRKEA